MKKIYLFATLILAVCFSACSDDDYNEGVASPQSYPQENQQTVDGFEFSLGSGLASPMIITEENVNDSTIINAVSLVSMGQVAEGAAITAYTIEISDVAEFTNKAEISSTYAEGVGAINAAELNSAVKSLYGSDITERVVYMRVYYYLTDGTQTVLMPNPVTFGPITVTPFTLARKPLYLTGNLINGIPAWTNSADAIGNGLQVLFADQVAGSIYTYTGLFDASSNFKLPIVAGDWNTGYAYKDGKVSPNNDGDNFPGPDAAGYYTLNIDLDALSFEIAPYTGSTSATYASIGLVGDATAGGWDADTYLTQVTPHVWTATVTLTEGTMKFRANGAWDNNWGIPEGQTLPYGISGFNTNAPNFSIGAAGEYFVALNDLTGHYIVILKSELK